MADNSEAMTKLMNITGHNGLEAWRLLKRHYEPLTLGNMRLRMDRLLRPKPAETLDQTISVIAAWEKEVREYETRFRKTLDTDAKLATLVSLAPEAVRRHIFLNDHAFNDYAATRKLVMDYVDQHVADQQLGVATQEAVPMEIGCLERRILALEAKGKGKTHSKGAKGKGQEKGKAKGKGQEAKGKGKNSQKGGKEAARTDGKIQGYYGLCGKWGHSARVGTQEKQQSKHWHSRRRVRVAALERTRPPERLHQPPAPHKEHTRSQYTCFR